MSSDTPYEIAQMYSPAGLENRWAQKEKVRLPEIATKYTQAMIAAGVLPNEKGIDGFVFYSPTANQRTIEFAVADYLNKTASSKVKNNPKVYMSDIFGETKPVKYTDPEGTEHETSAFIPSFTKTTNEYPNVDLVTFSADAKHIPLKDKSVNVVWDRLGALWFALSSRKYGYKTDEAFISLLNEYKRVLKQDGALVIDAGGSGNTYLLAQDVNFKDLGWEVNVSGNEENQIAIFKPTST